MNKKIYILLGVFTLIIIGWVLFINSSFNRKLPDTKTSIPVAIIPTAIKKTITPSFSIDQQKEKILEENYAKERQIFLNEKPWVLNLPLISDNYFISYDPENNRLLASIYHISSDPLLKKEQLDIAKQDVFKALEEINVDLNTEGVLFKELKKVTPEL